MAEQATSLQEILARLGAAQSGQPPPPGSAMPAYPPSQQSYPPPAGAPYGAPPGAYPYPQPSASGSVDLSKVAPYQSGTAPGASSIQDAIARARSFAADHGATPYERPPGYGGDRPASGGPPRYGRSRSRSPSRRDGDPRGNYNPYRDDRREDRGRDGGSRDRDRSFSPRGRRAAAAAGAGGNMFSPRGAHGGARERSPLRGDDNSETMQIEGSLVGLIIGRQGENLRRIEGDTQCRVQFLPASASDGDHRLCKITGPPPRRAEARAAINRIIDDSGMTPLNRGGFDRGGRAERGGAGAMVEPKEGEECLQIMVPDRTVGLIIGRGGETIRDLQERSGCHINIVGESKSVNGLRPVNLIGTHETSMRAKNLIMEIVESDTRNGGQAAPGGPPHGAPRGHRGDQGGMGGGMGGGDRINDSIYVPSDAVGMIIGKGGETIREMQSSTGCKINVSQSSGPNETEREIGLVGSRDSIERAKRAIEDKVETVRQKNSGGGGGGGGFRGGRGAHRDYDSPNYGQPSNHSAAQPQQPPAIQAAPGQPAPAAGGPDPYAACKLYLARCVSMFFFVLSSDILQQTVATKHTLLFGFRQPWRSKPSSLARRPTGTRRTRLEHRDVSVHAHPHRLDASQVLLDAVMLDETLDMRLSACLPVCLSVCLPARCCLPTTSSYNLDRHDRACAQRLYNRPHERSATCTSTTPHFLVTSLWPPFLLHLFLCIYARIYEIPLHATHFPLPFLRHAS
ncbi:hypothetical protein RB598_000315 [Gaeumannomyces tritici]